MSLLTDLISYWKLNGDSLDATASNNDGTDTAIDYVGILSDYYNTNDDNIVNCYGNAWRGQTFTTSHAYTTSKVRLKMLRVGSPGTVTVSIYATSGGVPTGSALVSNTTDGDTLTTDGGGEWRVITLSTPLSTSTMYAIVVSCGGDASNKIQCRNDVTSPSYAGGTEVVSANAGVDWSTEAGEDVMFEVYETTGKINQGAGFNGTTSTVTVADSAGLSFTGDFSISAWIKRGALGGGSEMKIVTKADNSEAAENPPYQFGTSDADGLFAFYGDSSANTSKSATNAAVCNSIGVWYHVVVTVDVSEKAFIFYVDGSAVADTNSASAASSIEDTDGDFNIGAINYGGLTGFFNGAIDEIGIWSRVLTSGEVTSLYNSGSGWVYPFSLYVSVYDTITVSEDISLLLVTYIRAYPQTGSSPLSIVNDSFNSYTDGDLNGQGSWSGSTEFDVQGTVVQEGAKAVALINPTGTVRITKTGTAQATGTQTCYFRASDNTSDDIYFELYEGATYITSIFTKTGHFKGSVSGGSVDLGVYNANTWYKLDIYWESAPAHKVKFQINGGGYTAAQDPYADWTTSLDKVGLASVVGTVSIYFDLFGNTTVDGVVTRTSAGENIATISAGAGTASDATGTTINAVYLQGNATPLFVQLDRSIFLFDTSELPDGDTIDSATLNLYVSASVDNLTGQTFNVVASTPATDNALVNADFGQLGTTKFSGDINVGGQTTSAYLSIPLNAAGLAAISKTGITKLGLRLTCDGLSGSVTASNNDAYLQVNGSENTNKPYLEVTYSSGSGLQPNESITVSEDISLYIPTIFLPLVNESVTVSEDVVQDIFFSFYIIEPIIVSDNIDLFIETLYISEIEDISVSDVFFNGINYIDDVFESITISEEIYTFIPSLSLLVVEDVTVSEYNVLDIPVYIGDVYEEVTIDDIIYVYSIDSTIDFESIVVSEYIILEIVLNTTINDSITVTENTNVETFMTGRLFPNVPRGNTSSYQGLSGGGIIHDFH